MAGSSAARKAAAPTFAELAEQLRDGPLKCLTALQDQATTLADHEPLSDREVFEHLQQLVTLAQSGMLRFHEFTTELRTLIDHLADESGERH